MNLCVRRLSGEYLLNIIEGQNDESAREVVFFMFLSFRTRTSGVFLRTPAVLVFTFYAKNYVPGENRKKMHEKPSNKLIR